MEIEFKPEDIESYVKNAIMKSSIGNAIETSIAELLKGRGLANPIMRVIQDMIAEIAKQVIADNYQDRIRELVKTSVENLISKELLEKMTQECVYTIARNIESY